MISMALPLFATADQVVEVQNKVYYLCKNRKEARTIRVHINEQGQCNTFYSKAGVEKVVGTGKMAASCEHILDNIKNNLEKSSWTCRDISATRITASVEEKTP
jgi:hypothetical protein